MNARSSTKVVIVALGLAIAYTAFFSSPAAERGPGVRRPPSLGELSFLASPLDEPGRIAACCRPCQDGAADRRTVYGDAPALKIDPRSARSPGCAPPAAGMAGEEAFPARDLLPKSLSALPDAKAGRVAAMVERALAEQARMLKARRAEMEEWDRPAQVRFARWFGTLDQNAQLQIYRRLGAVLKINAAYSVRNFRRAVPSRRVPASVRRRRSPPRRPRSSRRHPWSRRRRLPPPRRPRRRRPPPGSRRRRRADRGRHVR